MSVRPAGNRSRPKKLSNVTSTKSVSSIEFDDAFPADGSRIRVHTTLPARLTVEDFPHNLFNRFPDDLAGFGCLADDRKSIANAGRSGNQTVNTY